MWRWWNAVLFVVYLYLKTQVCAQELPPLIECKERPIIRLTPAKLNELGVGFRDMIVISPERLESAGDVDPKCVRSFNNSVIFEFKLEDCSPIITQDEYYIYVTYVVRNQPYKDPREVVARFEDNCFNLTCKFDRKENISMGPIVPTIKKTDIGYELVEAKFELEMCFYEDDEFEVKLRKDQLKVIVYDDVFVKIALPDIEECDEEFILQIKKCYATRHCDEYDPMYKLVSNSCSANKYVTIISNYEPLWGSFKFKSFVWTNVSDEKQTIVVHCDISICYKDNETTCERGHDCETFHTRYRRHLPSMAKTVRISSDPLTILQRQNNLCADRNGGCSDECWMDVDEVRCLCFSGRTLGRDRRTCYDVQQLNEEFALELEISESVVQTQWYMIMIFMGLLFVATLVSLHKRITNS